MLVPWLVVGAPLAAAILRLTPALTIDAMGEHWVRTARAKGVRHGRVVRKPRGAVGVRDGRVAVRRLGARSSSRTSCWSRSSSPCPGFFRHLRRALGQNVGGGDKIIDIPMMQAISIWAAVLIVALSLIADLAIVRLDPRIRTGGPV